MRLTREILTEMILDEMAGRGRPKIGMNSPNLSPGDRVKLVFSTQETNKDDLYKKANKQLGRIISIDDTPRGLFYTVRLFHGKMGGDGHLYDKISLLTDKNVRLENR